MPVLSLQWSLSNAVVNQDIQYQCYVSLFPNIWFVQGPILQQFMSPSLKSYNVSSNFNSNGYQVITLCMPWMLSSHGMCKITSCWDTHDNSTYFYKTCIMRTCLWNDTLTQVCQTRWFPGSKIGSFLWTNHKAGIAWCQPRMWAQVIHSHNTIYIIQYYLHSATATGYYNQFKFHQLFLRV